MSRGSDGGFIRKKKRKKRPTPSLLSHLALSPRGFEFFHGVHGVAANGDFVGPRTEILRAWARYGIVRCGVVWCVWWVDGKGESAWGCDTAGAVRLKGCAVVAQIGAR